MKIAQVTYINLDIRPDRRAHMEKVLRDCPIPPERFAAIRLDDDPATFGLKVRPDLASPRAVASIWKSHVGVLEAFLAGPDDGLLCVIEDDASISGEFWAHLDGIVARLPDDWRVVLISLRFRDRKQMFVDGRPHFIPCPFGTDPFLLHRALSDYFMTGAHLVIFRGKDVVRSILADLNAVQEIIDIDRFFATLPGAYGIAHAGVTAGGFGSDHD